MVGGVQNKQPTYYYYLTAYFKNTTIEDQKDSTAGRVIPGTPHSPLGPASCKP